MTTTTTRITTTTSAPGNRRLRKRMTVMLILICLLFGLLVAFNIVKTKMIAKYMATYANAPVTVSATRATYQTWQPRIAAVGNIRAAQGVEVTTEVAGLVRQVNFKSGEVKAGQVLVRLTDDADVAQLQSLKAAADLAQTIYNRDKAQYEFKAIAKATLDADAADLRGKNAQVAQQQAVLDKKTIRAPFSGRLGITKINPGQYLNPGDAIVTLQALEPVYADFHVPQEQLGKLALGQAITVDSGAHGEKTRLGTITSIDPKVDSATRQVQVEARVDNHDQKLLPGMYANVEIEAGTTERYLTLPQTALTYNSYGATVFVVKPGTQPDEKGKVLPVAEQVFVTPGATRGDQVAILTGVPDDTQVVTSGQMKLKNGTQLLIDNSANPANDANPTPQDH
ncbi:RND family efflux transporter MFP subunit [Caballeronia udeis]|uniref:RND family efflux transporter MFP subunit n=2 Tax=Caballeronia udeis TaxID=1232866 RepID=A0A158GMC6_9BURK|nr:RND family efflux transporter MFP subunit [Caballeronia udeis]